MNIDLSIFLRQDNLVFLIICLVLFAVLIALCIILAGWIIKFFKELFGRETDNKNIPGADKKGSGSVKENNTPGTDQSFKMPNTGPALQAAGQSSLKQKTAAKSQKQNWDEKEKKDIESELQKIKTGQDGSSGTNDIINASKIQVPRPKRPGYEKGNIATDEPGPQQGKYAIKDLKGFAATESSAGSIMPPPDMPLAGDEPAERSASQNHDFAAPFEKQDILKSKLASGAGAKTGGNAPSGGQSFFGKSGEFSRRDFKYKMMKPDQKSLSDILRTQKNLGLNLSRQDRSKLVEKYFPNYYGTRISKDEFRKQISKLERTPVQGSPLQRKQVMNEIKLLKKIGGVK